MFLINVINLKLELINPERTKVGFFVTLKTKQKGRGEGGLF